MGTKVFATIPKYKAELTSDDRDIAVDYKKRSKVWEWCVNNDITVEYSGSLSGRIFGLDLWRIKDEQQRMLFLLKWGTDATH